MIAGCVGAGYLGAHHWLLDLCAHFRVQYAYATALLFGWFLVLRSWVGVLATLALFGAILPDLFLLASRTEVGADVQSRPALRVLFANVHTQNREFERLIALVRQEKPELVVLEEVDTVWSDALAPLRVDYPHEKHALRPDNFGIAVLSKVVLTKAGIRSIGGALPSIEAWFVHGGNTWKLLATHAVPPTNAAAKSWRDTQLLLAANYVQSLGAHSVLMGDFNTTPWSPVFRQMLAQADLRDSAQGFGAQPTWPMKLPGILRIPLDHCLCSPDVAVTDRRLLGPIGSDHMPILFELR
ncbi:MAG: endonuclease/exonuclease/phosphatase family protein [Planctomycetes bacterium]|nr:endonuclease/exonuclease/phosphatase family protein [Planctomycetota bacterium]